MPVEEAEMTGGVAVLEPNEEAIETGVETEAEGEKKERLELKVDVADAGPCKKHIKVTVPRSDVDKFFNKEFTDLLKTASVPGFRPGKTPRKLIEKKFKKEVSSQIKGAIILQALEQIGDEQKIEALSEPTLDYGKIELPDEGDFDFAFDVEVRPEFDVPPYKGLKIKRPNKVFSDADVEVGVKAFLREQGKYEPKDGPIAIGDAVEADVRIMDGYIVLKEFEGLQVQVRKDLFFKDGKIDGFGDMMTGLKVGDSKEMTAVLSASLNDPNLRSKEVKAIFVVGEVKLLVVPELDQEFMDKFGFDGIDEVKDFVKKRMEMRLAHAQRNQVRDQIMKQLTESTKLELPRDLLMRQAQRTFDKYLVELQEAGFGPDEMQARVNTLRQDAVNSTAKLLREQFVLQRIAEEEKIEVNEQDLEMEIRQIAARSNESFRRVKARVEKNGLWEALALQVIERRTLDTIIESAESEDVPYVDEVLSSTGLDEAAVDDMPPEDEKPADAEETST